MKYLGTVARSRNTSHYLPYEGMIHGFSDLFEEPEKQVVDEIAAPLYVAFR